jgi:hypothetical protein
MDTNQSAGSSMPRNTDPGFIREDPFGTGRTSQNMDPGFTREDPFGTGRTSRNDDPGVIRDSPFGSGADMPDSTPDALWDKYQTRESKGAGSMPTLPPHAGWQPGAQAAPVAMRNIGAGGEGGMGAGGVYVKYPDGSMHWREDQADPNESGGSVVDPSGNASFREPTASRGPRVQAVRGQRARRLARRTSAR